MMNYRRLISYIYAYEGEVKGKNIGFAKLESRNGQCKLSVNVKKVYMGSSDLGVYLLAPGKEIYLGNIFIRGGAGEFRASVSVENAADSGCSMDRCYGLTIHEKNDSWRAYTTIWEDAVAHAAEIELADLTSQNRGDSQSQIHKKVEELNRELEAEERREAEQVSRMDMAAEENAAMDQEPSENKEPAPEMGQPVRMEENEEAGSSPGRDMMPEAVRQPEENLGGLSEWWTQIGSNEQLEQPPQPAVNGQLELPPQSAPNGQEEQPPQPAVNRQEEQLPQPAVNGQEEQPLQPAANGQEEQLPQPAANGQEEQSLQPAANGQQERPLQPAANGQEEQPLQLAPNEQAEQTLQPAANGQQEQPLQPAANGRAEQPPQPAPNERSELQPKPVQTEQSAQATPPTLHQEEPEMILGNPKELERLDLEERQNTSPQALWDSFRKRYPKIQAFDSPGSCEILTIKPQDIGLLPRETWNYGNNSFLLHGYYSYRYLILARVGDESRGRIRYILGFPGHYCSNEKYMASMFGFPHFVLSKKQPSQDGRFGYWYTDIRMENQDT